jgi:ABC-type dipeptide/oligopeptide/nickel transport system permease component
VLVRIEGPLVWSLLEFVVAMTLAFLVGSWWGRVAGWRPERKVGRVLSFAAVGAESAFPPWLTFIVAYGLVAVAGRGVFGSMGQLDRSVWVAPPDSLGVMVRMLTAIVFFFAVSIVLGRVGGLRRWRRRWTVLAFALAVAGPVVVWVQTGIWAKVVDVLGFLALPTAAMVVLFYGEIMLIVESVVQDVRSEPYVMTARAKGLPGRRVRDRHAGRMALLPAISRLAISLPFFMTGLVIVEFSLSHQTAGNLAIGASGIGTLLFFSIQAQDIPTVMGLLLVIGVLTLLVRLVLDVVAAALDPRIRMGGQEVPARRRV